MLSTISIIFDPNIIIIIISGSVSVISIISTSMIRVMIGLIRIMRVD